MTTDQAPIVEEVVTRLNVGGAILFEWRCTPTDLAALVVGRLYIEGMIQNADGAGSLDIVRTGNDEIEISMPALPAMPDTGDSADRRNKPDVEHFADLFKSLFSGVDDRNKSGGMHAAALALAGTIAFQAEDVGRHNAVDKVVGMALLEHDDPARFGMLVSSRVSGEIARKAARAGVQWLASRSIPTTLAVRFARTASMPIVGRAAGKGAFIY